MIQKIQSSFKLMKKHHSNINDLSYCLTNLKNLNLSLKAQPLKIQFKKLKKISMSSKIIIKDLEAQNIVNRK